MATMGLLPDLEKKAIMDKSKADSLGKALVCFQILWMSIQTIARIPAKLPITLLEVNTVAHVFCGVILFLIWWHKPKDISEPQPIKINHFLAAVISEDRRLTRIPIVPGSTDNQLQAHEGPRGERPNNLNTGDFDPLLSSQEVKEGPGDS